MTDKAKITISEDYYKELLESKAKLIAFEDAGVDNWEGIDYAYESLSEIRRELGLPDE